MRQILRLKFLGRGVVCAVLLKASLLAGAELPKEPEKLAPAQAVNAYLAVVEDPQQTRIRRNYAAAQIVKLGDAALPRLIELYQSAGHERRGYLAEVLGRMKEPGEPAVNMLLDDVKRNRLKTHPNTIRALGELHVPKATPLLLELLPGASEETRLTILCALGRLAEESAADALLGGLDSQDRLVRTTCANGVVSLLVKLKPKSSDAGKKDAYQVTFRKVLEYIEQGKHTDVRRILVSGMGTVNDPHASSVIGRVLRIESGPLQTAAARTLGQLKDPDAVGNLTERLFSDNASLRRAALEALGAIGDTRCVPTLIERLETSERAERRHIIRALQQLTRQSFGDNPAQWRLWWEEHGD